MRGSGSSHGGDSDGNEGSGEGDSGLDGASAHGGHTVNRCTTGTG